MNLRSVSLRPSQGQAALIRYIIKAKHGPTFIAEAFGVGRQRFTQLPRQGVPLLYCKIIAKYLGVSPYALNYDAMYIFEGYKGPSWNEVVASISFLPKQIQKEVLSLKAPHYGRKNEKHTHQVTASR